MLYPDVFGKNIFDDFFDFQVPAPHRPHQDPALMKTDVKETSDGYELTVDLPGVKKENISAELENGYLTIKTNVASEESKKDENGRYIRRERYSGSYSRSFYVGDNITEEDIKAKLENGVLTLDIPKKNPKKDEPKKRLIAIDSSDA